MATIPKIKAGSYVSVVQNYLNTLDSSSLHRIFGNGVFQVKRDVSANAIQYYISINNLMLRFDEHGFNGTQMVVMLAHSEANNGYELPKEDLIVKGSYVFFIGSSTPHYVDSEAGKLFIDTHEMGKIFFDCDGCANIMRRRVPIVFPATKAFAELLSNDGFNFDERDNIIEKTTLISELEKAIRENNVEKISQIRQKIYEI